MASPLCNSSSSSPNSAQFGDGDPSFPLAITKDSLQAAQMADLCKIMDLFVIKESQARTLLMQHRWNVERIFEQFERKGKDRLFSEAGISINNNNKDTGLMNLEKLSKSGFKCNVCFEELELSDFTAMDCGHHFCNSCWTEHFIMSINNNQATQIRCMSINCRIICDQNTVYHLTLKKDREAATRFTRFLTESYVTDNSSVQWCPSTPPCGRAIRIAPRSDSFREVECLCGTRFCFNCLGEAHSPCPCRIWEMWTERTKDSEKRSLDWIADNAKVCPGCGNAVMKEGGCDLVTCRCSQSFCWLCGDPTGNYHTCDRIERHICNPKSEHPKRNPNPNPNSDKTKLRRYPHYYERYLSHSSSLQKESASFSLFQTKFLSLPNWILTGFESLVNSRRALCHMYPFAFYMFGSELADNNLTDKEIRRDLFEDQQGQLEICVERLAVEVENFCDQIAPCEVSELARLRVVNLSKLVDKCCMDMYDCIQEELLPNLGMKEFIAPYRPFQGLEKARAF
ncbi:hypothetical protein LUZ60_005054 [Juncus effusus]|nr:hypothetical protein LUZ60_005054 [Juncus effusus]